MIKREAMREYATGSLWGLPAADPARWVAIGEQTDLILDDATRMIAQPVDLAPVRDTAHALLGIVKTHLHARDDSMLNQS